MKFGWGLEKQAQPNWLDEETWQALDTPSVHGAGIRRTFVRRTRALRVDTRSLHSHGYAESLGGLARADYNLV